jgi:hypothetical protein
MTLMTAIAGGVSGASMDGGSSARQVMAASGILLIAPGLIWSLAGRSRE